MVQPGERDQPAEAGALRVGVDTDDVHLAEVVGVPLGPVEGQQTALGAVGGVDGQDQAGGVEPVLGHPLGEVLGVHRTLLGVRGEGGGVDPQHRLGVGVGVGAQPHARGRLEAGQRHRRTPAHHPQLAITLEAGAFGQTAGGGVVGVRPGLELDLRADLAHQPLEQLAAQAVAAGLGGHDQRDLSVDEHRDALALDPRPEPVGVAQRHQGGLVERRGAVGGLREGGDPFDLAGVVEGVHSPEPSQRPAR